jgi:hypothetical protein
MRKADVELLALALPRELNRWFRTHAAANGLSLSEYGGRLIAQAKRQAERKAAAREVKRGDRA